MAMSAAERQRSYRERQRVRMAEDPDYFLEVKAKRATADSQYRARRDRDKVNARMRNWYARKVEEGPEYRERKAEQTKNWRANHPEQAAEFYKRWYENHDRSEYNLAWSRANRDKRRESDRRRKALLKGASVIESFSKNEIWERDSGTCGICGEDADPNDWHLDHVIPLSRGGAHTVDNVQVSHPKCNLSKGAKLPTEVEIWRRDVFNQFRVCAFGSRALTPAADRPPAVLLTHSLSLIPSLRLA